MNSDGTDNFINNKSDTSDGAPVLSTSADKNQKNIDSTVNINSSESEVYDEEPRKSSSVKNENGIKRSGSKRLKKHLPLFLNILQTALGAAVGVGAGFLLLYYVIPGLLTVSGIIYLLLILILSLFLNLNLYKLGQLIAGCACGGKITAYQFACLNIYRSEEKLHCRFTLTHSFEGQCVLLPPSDRPCRSNLYITFYTGGVTACAFAGCFCIISAICLSLTASGIVFFFGRTSSFLMFLWINGTSALLYAAACLIPVFWGDSPSDGSIISALIKKSPYAAHLIKLRSVTVQLAAGIRPSDLKIPFIILFSVTKKAGHKTAIFRTMQKKLSNLFSRLCGSYCFRCLHKLLLFKKNTNDPTADIFIDSTDVITAAEILDILQSEEPEDQSADNIPESILQHEVITPVVNRPADEPSAEAPINEPACEKKKKNDIRYLFNILKVWFRPHGKYMGDFEINKFPEPQENDNNLSAYSLILEIYYYFIALDNAERGDMQKHIRLIEENITHIPRNMLPRVCRELCFYYSIDKNPASATRYMEMMDNLPKQKDCIDDQRVRAYFEMYIKRRHKTAFLICRDALEAAGPETASGLKLMNTELIKGLVILIHQRNPTGKNEA